MNPSSSGRRRQRQWLRWAETVLGRYRDDAQGHGAHNELIQAHAKVENALCSSTAPREGGFFATDTQFTTSHKSAKFETNGAEQPRPNSGFGIRPFEGAAAAPCDAAIIVLLLERTGQESLLLLFGPVSQSGFPRAAACQWWLVWWTWMPWNYTVAGGRRESVA